MNSGIITVHHNDPDNFIDDSESFLRYHILLLSEYKGTNIQTIPVQVSNEQLYGVSNFHVFTKITMFNFIRPVKCNVQILNFKKSPAKSFGWSRGSVVCTHSSHPR